MSASVWLLFAYSLDVAMLVALFMKARRGVGIYRVSCEAQRKVTLHECGPSCPDHGCLPGLMTESIIESHDLMQHEAIVAVAYLIGSILLTISVFTHLAGSLS